MKMKCTLGALVESRRLEIAAGTEKDMFDRISQLELSYEEVSRLNLTVKYLGVTEEFKKVIRTFQVKPGEIPAGFRAELLLGGDNSIQVDLKRDISYAANNKKRPTKVLYSANSANPKDVFAMKDMIANLTTNPQIIFSQFLNNPEANVNGQFKNPYEVIQELCNILGPGVDISVEVTNPFAPEQEIMEEIAKYEEILTKYRIVVKVPHSGPLNSGNVEAFLKGENFYVPYDKASPSDFFAGHNLAYKFQEKGYRVNFTLMFEPYQTALALLARPYFINSFVENRYIYTKKMQELIRKYDSTGDVSYKKLLRNYMIQTDMLASNDQDDEGAMEKAREIVSYRTENAENYDGLDCVRHNLRMLKQSHLDETRLIICNTKSKQIYYNIDKMLTEPEFSDMTHRIVLTCDPPYFGQFTSAPGIYYYQRAFLNSVK